MPVVQMIRQDIQPPADSKCLVVPSEIADRELSGGTICAFCGETAGEFSVYKRSLVCESCRSDLLSD